MLAYLFMSARIVVLACDRGTAIAVSSAPMARYHVRRCRTQSSHHARRGKIKAAANAPPSSSASLSLPTERYVQCRWCEADLGGARQHLNVDRAGTRLG